MEGSSKIKIDPGFPPLFHPTVSSPPTPSQKHPQKKGTHLQKVISPPYFLIFATLLISLLMDLSVSALNVNSLNSSQSLKETQTAKIAAITSLKTDIICLSDIRLSNKSYINCGKTITDMFKVNPSEQYDFFYNSSQNKRGTGILIKKC
jgi:hypothetical protein